MSKNVTDPNEAARIAYNRTDFSGSETFYPPHLRHDFKVKGTETGRFDSSKPNEGNFDYGKKDIVNPLTEKTAVEMVEGKKYLMVIHIPRNTPMHKIEAIQNSVPVYDAYFKARGIDMTLMVTDEPMSIYELEPACPKT